MRRLVQSLSALAQNAYLAFPWTATLYQGPLKRLCTPGLNCHSCPAAVLSCPLGTLQHFLGALRPALRWGTYRLGFYVIGFLLAVGLIGGRFTCAWLCPFGLLQDLLGKIPSPSVPIPRFLTRIRYLLLAGTVVLLPLLVTGPLGYGEAWYCRLICPAGTLEASGLFHLMPELTEQIGVLFAFKWFILAAVVVLAIVSFRPYCRVLCPLGAVYGLFNRYSLIQLEHDPTLCRGCGRCAEGCDSDLDPRVDSNRGDCLRCLTCATERCEVGALRVRIGTRRFGGKEHGPARS